MARSRTSSVRDEPAGAPRRALVVYDGIPPWRKGGAETRLGAIASGLATRGWAVSWMGLAGAEPPLEQGPAGVRVIAVGREPPLRSGARRSVWGVAGLLWALYRAPWPEVDVVLLGQSPWLHYFIARWRVPRGVPVVVDCWEVWGRFWRIYYGRMTGFLGSRVERAVLRRADLVACIAPQTRRAVLEQGADPARLRDLPNGVALREIGTGPPPDASARSSIGGGWCRTRMSIC